MTFSVKYRAKDGSIAEEVIEAADRGDCFAKCKARGIAVVELKVDSGKLKVGGGESRRVGDNAPYQRERIAARPESAPYRRSAPKLSTIHSQLSTKIAALLLIAIAGACIWLWLGNEPAKPEKAPVKKAEKKKAVKSPQVVKPATNTVKKTAKPVAKKEKPEFVKKPGSLQLPDGKVLTFPPPKEGETRKVHAYGHTYVCDHLGNFTDITPRRLFHTAFEANFLNLAVEGSAFIPAFLTGLDEGDVKKMLLKKYEHIGDETPAEMEKLKAYDDMRCAALEYMEQGGKFDDFVNEFAQFEKQQRQTRALGLSEVMKLVKQGKVAEAKEMAEAANLLMDQKGFKPIKLPAYVQKAFDEIPENK